MVNSLYKVFSEIEIETKVFSEIEIEIRPL